MTQLPTEILINVFTRLPLPQKIECSQVCRKWKAAVNDGCLLQTVIIESEARYKKFLNLIKQYPHRTSQTERLIIRSGFSFQIDKAAIVNQLPNLQVLQFMAIDDILSSQRSKIATPSKRIRHLQDTGHCEMTWELLKFDLCSQLITLDLHLGYPYQEDRYQILRQLKNMPVLKKLFIHQFDMTIDHLETIHANLPSVSTLSLNHVRIIPTESSLRDIKPATSIIRFESRYIQAEIQQHVALLNYIQRKYTFLLHFVEIISIGYSYESRTQQYYTDGLLPLLEVLGPQLKTLELENIRAETDMLKKLDSYHCQIESLNIGNIVDTVEHFDLTHQAKNIQKFTLKNAFHFPLEYLNEMPCLKTLELVFGEDNVYERRGIVCLNLVLEACPACLETLSISNGKLIFDNTSVVKKFSLLKNLTLITTAKTTDGIDKFISDRFPNLRSLTISESFPKTVFMLSDFRLNYFEIKPHFVTNACRFALKTSRDAHYRLYIADWDWCDERLDFYRDDPFTYEAVVPNLDGKCPRITLDCASVNNVVLKNRILC